jgi:hypothetical protein
MASGKAPSYADGTDSGWRDASMATTATLASGGYLRVRKIGKLCVLAGYCVRPTATVNAGSSVILTTVAAKYRPSSDTTAVYGFAGNSTGLGQVVLTATSGNVAFYPVTTSWATNKNINFTIAYFTD